VQCNGHKGVSKTLLVNIVNRGIFNPNELTVCAVTRHFCEFAQQRIESNTDGGMA